MVPTQSKYAAAFAVIGAVFYQAFLKDVLWTTMGYGRVIDSIDSFGVLCQKVEGLGLEGCEDMWLHEPSGLLYIACSDSVSRVQWNPSLDRRNASGRGLNDRMAILDTRAAGPMSERIKWVQLINFDGINGDGTINLQGFDVHVSDDTPPILRMLLVNNRPPIDPKTRSSLDASKLGSNSTIELFETTLGEKEMRFLKTFHHPKIQTPNNVAFMGPNAFVTTNDKSNPNGFRRQLDPVIGGGSVAYCNMTDCQWAATSGFNYPNGLIRGADNLVYVPSPITGTIHVMELQPDTLLLKRLKIIYTGYPLDNLSLDSNGDIFAATFPQMHKTLPSFTDPNIHPPSGVLRIRRLNGDGLEYEVVKVLEDDGSVLPASTVAVHDPGSPERFFLGGESLKLSLSETY